MTMSTTTPNSESSVSYAGLGDGITFLSEPLDLETEITGPIAAKLWVSSATEDADLFLVVRAFTPDLKEVTFQGALDAHTPIAQGWLRCSHRKLDPKLTLPYRPYHTHDEEQKLTPGRVTRSTSKYGRLVSCCRKVIGSHCRCAAPTTFSRASPAPGWKRWVKVWTGSAPSPITTRATDHRQCSVGMSRCTPARAGKPTCAAAGHPEAIGIHKHFPGARNHELS